MNLGSKIMIVPAILIVLLFILTSIVLNIISLSQNFNYDFYIRSFIEPKVINTLTLYGSALVGQVVLAFILSLIILKAREGKIIGNYYMMLALMPFAIIIVSIVCFMDSNYIQGFRISSFGGLTLKQILFDNGNMGLYVIAALSTIQWTGCHSYVFFSIIKEIPKTELEMAKVDGISGIRSYYYILFPHLKEYSLMITIMMLVSSYNVYEISYLFSILGVGNNGDLFSEWFNSIVKGNLSTANSIASLSAILTTVFVFLTLFVRFTIGKLIEISSPRRVIFSAFTELKKAK